jgi:cell volume regulation protein A
MIFFTYAVTSLLHGSGFLAVYVAGMVLGNHDFIHRKSLIRFYEGITWLMQIAMFIALGLLVDLNMLWRVTWNAFQLSCLLMFVARPISVFLVSHGKRFTWKSKIFISWAGLRGAVPIIFASQFCEYMGQTESAQMVFHIVFFVVLSSILLQGTTLHPLASWLGLEDHEAVAKMDIREQNAADSIKKMLIEIELPLHSPVANKPIVELCFPEEAVIALIYREKRYLRPRGDTAIKEGDKLLILVDGKQELQEVRACLGLT